MLHSQWLFPANPTTRAIASQLYGMVKDLPIVSPHGHTEARWFARNEPFPDPATLLIQPDHYIFRMLYSQGIPLEALEIGEQSIADPRAVWRLFARNYFLFRGTPTRLWLDYAFQEIFGLEGVLSEKNADFFYDTIQEKLLTPEFRPRALYERFKIEVLATTNSALDPLTDHHKLKESDWNGRVIPTFRPDAVVDPDFDDFLINVEKLGETTGEDVSHWRGYLNALRASRKRFREMSCTATDHGHPTANTANLGEQAASQLFDKVRLGRATSTEKETFRAQMLTEMAQMSVEDGLVMQIHPGSMRNHNEMIYRRFGRDMGADIPTPTDYVRGLQPMLQRVGNEPDLTIILFTLDESTYSRELAPLAGHYPCIKLGPPWWFFDSPEGMLRFRETTTETAGFYNTVGFNDDTRAFLSIPGRHDVARRVDCAFLARLVAEHSMEEDEAREVARDLAYRLAKKAYRL